jgi:hypothetical protein
MKTVALVTLLLFISVFVQTTGAQSTDPIETIRQHYAAINKNVTLYRRARKTLPGYSEEGGQLIAYFNGPTIMKIAATFFGETGRSTEEYYYWDGKLIFVFRREARYDKPLSGTIVATKESRLYFKDDKMIRWIDENGKDVAAGSTEFAEKEKEYLQSSKDFSEHARGAVARGMAHNLDSTN